MELVFVWNNFSFFVPFSDLTDCAPLMLRQNSLCFVNTYLLLKHCQQLLQKYFFIFIFLFCFVKHKSVKVFDVHIMRFITINYKQQIHRVFQFLIWNVNWKSHLVFITNTLMQMLFFFSILLKSFSRTRNSIPSYSRSLASFFIFPCNSFWIYFYRINMPKMAP